MDLSLPPVVSANTHAIELDLSLGGLFGADANAFFADGYSGVGVVEEDPLLFSGFDTLTMRSIRASGSRSVRKTAAAGSSIIDEDEELDDGLAGLDAAIGAIGSDVNIGGNSACVGGVEGEGVLRIGNETQPVAMAVAATTPPSSARRESNCSFVYCGTAAAALDGDNRADGASFVELAVFPAPSSPPINLPTTATGRNLQSCFAQPQLGMLPTEDTQSQIKLVEAIRVPFLQHSSMRLASILPPIALSLDPPSNRHSPCEPSDDAKNRNTKDIIHGVPHPSNPLHSIRQQPAQIRHESLFGDSAISQDVSTATTISNSKTTAFSSVPSLPITDSRTLLPDLRQPPPPSELSPTFSVFSFSADSLLCSTTQANLTPSMHPIDLEIRNGDHRTYGQQSPQQAHKLSQMQKPPLKPIKIKFKQSPADTRLTKDMAEYREHKLKQKRKQASSPPSVSLPCANGIDAAATVVVAAKAAISSAQKRLRFTITTGSSVPMSSTSRGATGSGNVRPVPSHSKITLLEKTGLISGPESLLLRVRREVERIERAVFSASGVRESATPSSSSNNSSTSSGIIDIMSCIGDFGSCGFVVRDQERLHGSNTPSARNGDAGDSANFLVACSTLDANNGVQCELKLEKETNQANLRESSLQSVLPPPESTLNLAVCSAASSAWKKGLQNNFASLTESDERKCCSMPVNESAKFSSENFSPYTPRRAIVESSEIPSPSPFPPDAKQPQFTFTTSAVSSLRPPPVTAVNTLYRISEKKILHDFFARSQS
ncbi:hypothetical protein HDU84_002409 [Entophlyctis sp. JEL0112]|nr:hypothetical protein HDU84_002409 [Entophlyctis sp. JEL0112]